jgi:hypothetical protein
MALTHPALLLTTLLLTLLTFLTFCRGAAARDVLNARENIVLERKEGGW